MDNQDGFNPIKFLNLAHLSSQQQAKLLPKIYKDMTVFLLKKFVENLDEKQLGGIEDLLPSVKTYDGVISLIKAYDPNFQNQKLKYLEDYKKGFDLKRLISL